MFFILIQVPLLPILPVISVFVNVYLMLKLSSATWIRFGVWMFLGRWHGIRILRPFTFQYHSSCWAANSKNWNICYSFFFYSYAQLIHKAFTLTIFHTRNANAMPFSCNDQVWPQHLHFDLWPVIFLPSRLFNLFLIQSPPQCRISARRTHSSLSAIRPRREQRWQYL